MSRATLSSLLFLLLLVAPAPALVRVAGEADKDKNAASVSVAKLERGMTPEQVRQLLGAPKHIARQILYHRYREQWLYETPLPVRLTFDCLRGQKPQLLFPPTVPQKD